MWRVDYGDGKDSHSTKLEPFMASQAFANVNSEIYSSSIPTTPLPGHLHNTNLPAVDQHLVRATDEQQKKRRGSSNNIDRVGMGASSRWNPTPEQLYDLEEMYRSGTRTPTANQIQQIALKLRRFGKIEGKNVFYWFQNHKARDRQRRRRQEQMLYASSLTEKPLHILQTKLSAELSRTCFEVGQTKNMMTPSNSSTISEESVSMPTNIAAKSKTTDEGMQIEMTEFQQRNSSKNHAMKRSLEGEREYQTLELFPLPQGHCDRKHQKVDLAKDDSEWQPMRNSCSKLTPTQFFEFLPLKRH